MNESITFLQESKCSGEGLLQAVLDDNQPLLQRKSWFKPPQRQSPAIATASPPRTS